MLVELAQKLGAAVIMAIRVAKPVHTPRDQVSQETGGGTERRPATSARDRRVPSDSKLRHHRTLELLAGCAERWQAFSNSATDLPEVPRLAPQLIDILVPIMHVPRLRQVARTAPLAAMVELVPPPMRHP